MTFEANGRPKPELGNERESCDDIGARAKIDGVKDDEQNITSHVLLDYSAISQNTQWSRSIYSFRIPGYRYY